MSLKAKEQVYKIRHAQHEILKLRNALKKQFPEMAQEDIQGNADTDTYLFDANGNISQPQVEYVKKQMLEKLPPGFSKSLRPKSPTEKSKEKSIETLMHSKPPMKTSSADLLGGVLKKSSFAKLRQSKRNQGRLFHHFYRFQESTDPTPLTSRTATAYDANGNLRSKSFLVSARAAETQTLGKKVMWADNEGGSIATTAKVKVTPPHPPRKKENLCISSFIGKKGPTSWVGKRFPEIAKDIARGREAIKVLTNLNMDPYPTQRPFRAKKFVKARSLSTEDFFKDQQPLPHERGLVGVEISEFDAASTFFFRSHKKGTSQLYS